MHWKNPRTVIPIYFLVIQCFYKPLLQFLWSVIQAEQPWSAQPSSQRKYSTPFSFTEIYLLKKFHVSILYIRCTGYFFKSFFFFLCFISFILFFIVCAQQIYFNLIKCSLSQVPKYHRHFGTVLLICEGCAQSKQPIIFFLSTILIQRFFQLSGPCLPEPFSTFLLMARLLAVFFKDFWLRISFGVAKVYRLSLSQPCVQFEAYLGPFDIA